MFSTINSLCQCPRRRIEEYQKMGTKNDGLGLGYRTYPRKIPLSHTYINGQWCAHTESTCRLPPSFTATSSLSFLTRSPAILQFLFVTTTLRYYRRLYSPSQEYPYKVLRHGTVQDRIGRDRSAAATDHSSEPTLSW